MYAMWGTIIAALGVPAIAYLFFPPKTPEADPWAEAAMFRPGGDRPVELVFRRNTETAGRSPTRGTPSG